jgi:hypothetical protein
VEHLATVTLLCTYSNTNRDRCTHLGTRWSGSPYANDTAFEDVFTGAEQVTVKEIEVFEITD